MPESTALQVDVAIIGGGIAGLATALALADTGLSLLLVEARALGSLAIPDDDSVSGFDPRVSALTPRSVDFLTQLGVWSQVDAVRHAPYQHMTVWDAEGTAAIEFDAAELGAPMLGTIVENRLITAALAGRLQRASGIEIRAPGKLADARRSGSEITLRLDDDATYQCQLLIAADGALSPTRDLFGFRTREWEYGQRALVTTAEFERVHQHTAWQRFLPTGPLALLPLPSESGRLCSIVWSIDESRAEAVESLDDAAFAVALAEASEYRLGQVTACAKRYTFPLRQRHAVDYVQSGVALVADAAHTIHPLAGQGINLGLSDVRVLTEELTRAQGLGLTPGTLEVLKRYQRRRKGDNLAMMTAMDGFKRLFGHSAPPLRWLRNTGMRSVASVPALKRRIMREAMGIDAAG